MSDVSRSKAIQLLAQCTTTTTTGELFHMYDCKVRDGMDGWHIKAGQQEPETRRTLYQNGTEDKAQPEEKRQQEREGVSQASPNWDRHLDTGKQ